MTYGRIILLSGIQQWSDQVWDQNSYTLTDKMLTKKSIFNLCFLSCEYCLLYVSLICEDNSFKDFIRTELRNCDDWWWDILSEVSEDQYGLSVRVHQALVQGEEEEEAEEHPSCW